MTPEDSREAQRELELRPLQRLATTEMEELRQATRKGSDPWHS